MLDTGSVSMMMGIGVAFTLLAAIAFQMITGRMATLAFEDNDGAAVPLALLFRIVAGPGILVCAHLANFGMGRGNTMSLAWAALGLVWAASYGIGLGALA